MRGAVLGSCGVVVAGISLVLVGCSQEAVDVSGSPAPESTEGQVYEQVAPDGSVHAVLHEELESVRLPLDEFLPSNAEMLLVTHANDLLILDCLQQSGRDYSPAHVDWQGGWDEPSNREYGSWSVSRAAAYGYGVPESPYEKSVMAAVAADGTPSAEQMAAESRCNNSVERIPNLTEDAGHSDNPTEALMVVVDEGRHGGGVAAAESEEFPKVRAALAECFATNGLSMSDNPSSFEVTDKPEDPEGRVRTAVAEAKCHQEAKVEQTLYDIQAQYQAGYIAAHEAELAAVKQKQAEVLERAKQVIAEHGS
ncbi:hypothetical protein [Rathayibacter agropyri]|uniref:hypothetical protein n=1 Tax=Rathayibacter agropyri TaxID=1634927 RepID=UPI0015659048|nr:hypothetical protein [Rathayibacter agropyri]NRD08460.1 hypothetical protein [Rathayibacter agropyri]